jgi:hypothetical protein
MEAGLGKGRRRRDVKTAWPGAPRAPGHDFQPASTVRYETVNLPNIVLSCGSQ